MGGFCKLSTVFSSYVVRKPYKAHPEPPWRKFLSRKVVEDLHYKTVQLHDWQEYKSYVRQFSENWAFRGQGNADWVLNNAIERMEFINYYKGVEVDFVAEFQRGAR